MLTGRRCGTHRSRRQPWRLPYHWAQCALGRPDDIEPSAPNGPYLTVWRPKRTLRLLDLRGSWPIRQGASHVINTGPHPVCRRWAHAIAVHPQAVDGVLYPSTTTGADAAALFLPAADSFPTNPELSLPLSDPGLVGALQGAAERIGFVIA